MKKYTVRPSDLPELEIPIRAKEGRSLINICPESIREVVLKIPEDHLSLSEEQIKRRLAKERQDLKPEDEEKALELVLTPTDHQLRMNFWLEFERALRTGNNMSATAIYGGTCSREHWVRNILKHWLKVAFLLIPPPAYAVMSEEALTYGQMRLRRDFMTISIDGLSAGEQVKVGKFMLEATRYFDERVHGGSVQRAVNVNLNRDEHGKGANEPPEDAEEIEREIKQLEAQQRKPFHEAVGIAAPGAVREAEFVPAKTKGGS